MERYLSYYNFDPMQLIRCQRGEQRYSRIVASSSEHMDTKVEASTLSGELLPKLEDLLLPEPVLSQLMIDTDYACYELRFLEFDAAAKRYHGEWTSHFLFGVGIAYSSFSVSRDSLERFCRDVRQHLTGQTQTMASRT
jgi:hypothetical protein